jgi:CubicO group peptidase (beta-lactamase class C family)
MTKTKHTGIRRAAAACVLIGLLAACGADDADPAARTSSAAASQPSPEDWRAVEEFVQQLADIGEFSGAVLVARDGEPLVQQAYGLADRETSEPNDTETRFNIGSLGKMFTAVAIAQLVEQGRLAFDDTIGEYISGFPTAIADSVTIDQLLTHTSGMGDFARGGYPEAAKSAKTATELLALITGEPLLFEPGSRESYSNSGYVVLGAIIEAVSGQSYYDYVRDHVLAPAGMTQTDWSPPGQGGPNTARGYMRVGDDGRPMAAPGPGGVAGDGQLADNSGVVPWGNPSGGAYSTVGDLQRFGEALLDNGLLGPELTTTVLAGKVDIPGAGGARTAYGFTDGSANGVRIVGHGGGAPGVSAGIDIYPDLGYVVVVLANYDGAATSVQDRTRDLLTRSDR